MSFKRLIATTLAILLVLTVAMVNQAAAGTILVGGSTLNGDFNADTSTTDKRTFADTPNWVNIGTGDQTLQATRSNLDFDGSRNAVIAINSDRDHGLDTEYDIVAGDVFDIGYVWRDASGWSDADDQMQISLFVTDDDTIGGTRTNLAQPLSGLSTLDGTYETVDQDSVYTAVAGDAGRRLFVEIDVNNPDTGGFARLDNFTLEVTAIPEPSTFALVGLVAMGLAVPFLRRK